MALKSWSVYTTTGDGATEDVVVDTNLGYERFFFSIMISNYDAASAATVWVEFTDSADSVYFKFKRIVATETLDAIPYKMAINNGDKVKVISNVANVSVLISGDETYVG